MNKSPFHAIGEVSNPPSKAEMVRVKESHLVHQETKQGFQIQRKYAENDNLILKEG